MADIGARFGCWTVIGTKAAKAICQCDCGVTQEIRDYDLVKQKTKMCRGCSSKLSGKSHGASESDPTYTTWLKMKSRCTNPKDKDYDNYGGRGITVYPMWIESYESFLLMVGPRPAGMTLDRKDSNGNYEPKNVKWSTATEQNRNTKSNICITLDGETKVLSEWLIIKGLTNVADAVYKRINRGMDPVLALTTPVKSRK